MAQKQTGLSRVAMVGLLKAWFVDVVRVAVGPQFMKGDTDAGHLALCSLCGSGANRTSAAYWQS